LVRALWLAALLVCAGCSDEDQRYLLTYEKPQHREMVAARDVPPASVTAAPARSGATTERVPSTPPARVAEMPLPAPASAKNTEPAQAATPVEAAAAEPPAQASSPPVQTVAQSSVPADGEGEALASEPAAPDEAQAAPAVSAPPGIPPPAATVASTSAGTASREAHCRAVAQQRKDDAAANYYDDDTADQIYAGTYSNCMKWEAAHPSA
jgi:hypothetical protein